jgi:hypothetical protein
MVGHFQQRPACIATFINPEETVNRKQDQTQLLFGPFRAPLQG